jgi:hypothetical protein
VITDAMKYVSVNRELVNHKLTTKASTAKRFCQKKQRMTMLVNDDYDARD